MLAYQTRLRAENPPAPPPQSSEDTGSAGMRDTFGKGHYDMMAKVMRRRGKNLADQFNAPSRSQPGPAATIKDEWNDYCTLNAESSDEKSDSSPTLKFWHVSGFTFNTSLCRRH